MSSFLPSVSVGQSVSENITDMAKRRLTVDEVGVLFGGGSLPPPVSAPSTRRPRAFNPKSPQKICTVCGHRATMWDDFIDWRTRPAKRLVMCIFCGEDWYTTNGEDNERAIEQRHARIRQT